MIFNYIRTLSKVVALLLFVCNAYGQSNSVLDQEIKLTTDEATVSSVLQYLEDQYRITLSFNSRGINLDNLITFKSEVQSLRNIVAELFTGYSYKIVGVADRKVLLIFDALIEVSDLITIKGKIFDSSSGEVITGATIYNAASNAYTFSNEYGYYSLTVPKEINEIIISYLGYIDYVLREVDDKIQNVSLEFDNTLGAITILKRRTAEDQIPGSGGLRLNLDDDGVMKGISGNNDILELAKFQTGVQSGNEGQSGLYVRGGSPDQNLILLDGIPMYEVSHALGLSSVFIDESIRNVDFIKNGFPARYGGRLSSVIAVNLKEGNKSKLEGSVQTSLTDAQIHLEGPIKKDVTTFSISAKKSLINLYLQDIYTAFTEYDDIGVDYHDVTAKVTHRFSPARKFSVSYYSGGDNFNLNRSEDFFNNGDVFNTTVSNDIKWGSRILSAQFGNVVRDNLYINVGLGGSLYGFNSRSQYGFRSDIEGLVKRNEYDLRSLTEIVDYVASVNIDYFVNDKHRLKFGASYTIHDYRPEIRQSESIIDTTITTSGRDDKLIKAEEFGIYAEDTYTINNQWQLYMGAHFSGYAVGTDTKYSNFQPRLRLIYSPTKNHKLDFSYANTAQYVHLLVNPGTGLPADLWVPSTDNILPETSRQLSLTYTSLYGEGLKIKIGGYLKEMDNVLDYTSPVNLLFGVINKAPPLIEEPWENRVTAGKGFSRGLEFQANYQSDLWRAWLAYTWSQTDRTFLTINDGNTFPYKYDRRHDINMGLSYNISNKFDVTLKWIYGDGNAFSLALDEVLTFGGVVLINPGERNNYRLPSFQHLDLQFSFVNKYKNGHQLKFNLGIYNIYNRLNGFYIYVYENPLTGRNVARKVSVFPILPQLSASYSF